MTLLDALQKINSDQLAAAQLTDMAVGTVETVSPLSIRLDVHQASIKEDLLILTETVTGGGGGDRYFTEVDGELCVIWGQSASGSSGSGLVVGEKVLLLSVQHGQKFIVLSRL